MKGAGRGCTSLFNKKHAWVNFEAFLASCKWWNVYLHVRADRFAGYIGPLVEDEAPPAAKEGAAKASAAEAAVPAAE